MMAEANFWRFCILIFVLFEIELARVVAKWFTDEAVLIACEVETVTATKDICMSIKPIVTYCDTVASQFVILKIPNLDPFNLIGIFLCWVLAKRALS